jgi:hypothetical protein
MQRISLWLGVHREGDPERLCEFQPITSAMPTLSLLIGVKAVSLAYFSEGMSSA